MTLTLKATSPWGTRYTALLTQLWPEARALELACDDQELIHTYKQEHTPHIKLVVVQFCFNIEDCVSILCVLLTDLDLSAFKTIRSISP